MDHFPAPPADKPAVAVPSHPQPASDGDGKTRAEAQRVLARGETELAQGDVKAAIAAADQAFSCCENAFPTRTLRLLSGALAQRKARQNSETVRRFLQLETTSPEAVYGPAASGWTAALLEILAREESLGKLRQTVRSQKKQIETLEKRIEQLKAVDLELSPPEKAGEMP